MLDRYNDALPDHAVPEMIGPEGVRPTDALPGDAPTALFLREALESAPPATKLAVSTKRDSTPR